MNTRGCKMPEGPFLSLFLNQVFTFLPSREKLVVTLGNDSYKASMWAFV